MSSVFSHRPWSESEATEFRERARTRLAAKARRNQRINHVLMALFTFCMALGAVWIDQPSAPWLGGAASLAFVAALSFARSGLDPDLELRRWEFDNGFPVAPSSTVESLLADSTLPAEVPAAIQRWQALGYTLRRRDLQFLLCFAGRDDEAASSDQYFSYVLLREDA